MVKLRKVPKFMATGNEYFADEIGTETKSSAKTSDFGR
jgi:hypothetical protein